MKNYLWLLSALFILSACQPAFKSNDTNVEDGSEYFDQFGRRCRNRPCSTPTPAPTPAATATPAPTPTPAPSPTPTTAAWIFCADENGFCAFTGTRRVRYGANGVFNERVLTNGTVCTNDVFGDPLGGVVKQCFYSSTLESSPTPTPAPTSTPVPTPVVTPPPTPTSAPTPTPNPTPVATTGRVLYVNAATGNDSVLYSDNSSSNPWRTIGRAAWGSSSLSAPNSAQAARAGDVVIIASGTYTTPGTGYRMHPALNPVNSGTSGSPIRFQAAPGATVNLTLSSSSGPVIGCFNQSYIIWDGFNINEASAPTTSDTGLIDIFNSRNCEVHNSTLIGGDRNYLDNHNAIRIEMSDFTIVRNNSLSHVFSMGAQGINEALIMMYDSNDTLIENNTMFDAGMCVSVKGIHPGETQARTVIRKNICHTVGMGVMLYGAQETKVYQNIFHHISSSTIWEIGNVVGQNYSNRVVNNTIYSSSSAVYYHGTNQVYSDFLFANNIVSNAFNPIYSYVWNTPGDARHEHNVYANTTGMFAELSSNRYTFATWQAAGYDVSSPASSSADPAMVNPAGNDFHLQASSYARTLGRDVLNLSGQGIGAVIPAGAYITGQEIIGRR